MCSIVGCRQWSVLAKLIHTTGRLNTDRQTDRQADNSSVIWLCKQWARRHIRLRSLALTRDCTRDLRRDSVGQSQRVPTHSSRRSHFCRCSQQCSRYVVAGNLWPIERDRDNLNGKNDWFGVDVTVVGCSCCCECIIDGKNRERERKNKRKLFRLVASYRPSSLLVASPRFSAILLYLIWPLFAACVKLCWLSVAVVEIVVVLAGQNITLDTEHTSATWLVGQTWDNMSDERLGVSRLEWRERGSFDEQRDRLEEEQQHISRMMRLWEFSLWQFDCQTLATTEPLQVQWNCIVAIGGIMIWFLSMPTTSRGGYIAGYFSAGHIAGWLLWNWTHEKFQPASQLVRQREIIIQLVGSSIFF